MERDIVVIDEEKCNGCGDCIPNCHEGALQIIDGKARLISDLMCDGLGACIGHCPVGAMTIEKREAKPYNETEVMKEMINKGKNTIVAHLVHLKEHNENEFFKEGLAFLIENEDKLDVPFAEIRSAVHEAIHAPKQGQQDHVHVEGGCGGGCPGSQTVDFTKVVMEDKVPAPDVTQQSALGQWPVQMHLINPQASYFQNADVVIAADCVAFSVGDFHQTWLKGKSLAIACPKLDQGLDVYQEKVRSMIDDAQVNTLTVMIMQVPCCSGLLQLVKAAADSTKRKVPVKAVIVSIQGEILQEQWV